MTRRGDDALLEVGTALDLGDVRIGDSIAVSGACLTVTAKTGGAFTADVSAETLLRTNLGDLKAGDAVNLEKALALGDRLGGHIVLGHVDGVAPIRERTVRSQSVLFGFEIDPGLNRYVVAKGSITVDGISLTVNRCENNCFYVNIIPHTVAGTTLGVKKVSDRVNIETDVLARYVEKLLLGGPQNNGEPGGPKPGVDLALLARHGFMK
jgi:riboflavin synthase